MNLWRICVTATGAGLLSGCLSWDYIEIAQSDAPVHRIQIDSQNPYESLREKAALITSAIQLDQSIEDHIGYLKIVPTDPEALAALASQILLRGTAYTENRSEKREQFVQAMHYCERAMLTDATYAARVGAGASPWEACEELGPAHMDAMLFWVTSVLYMFREGMIFPQQILHANWIRHARQMLDHMESLDRAWNGGAVLFSQAIVYHVLPAALGGDPKIAQQYLAESISCSDGWMLAHWGRAKFFLSPIEDRESYREELAIVLASDLNLHREAPYWQRYFQAEAKSMIARSF